MKRGLVVLAVVGSACGGGTGSEATACEDAEATAQRALEAAAAANQGMQSVVAEQIDPDDYPTSQSPMPTDEGFYLSPESEAQMEANLKASGERRRHAAELRAQTERYTIVVEQNQECFSADVRARAEQLARQLE